MTYQVIRSPEQAQNSFPTIAGVSKALAECDVNGTATASDTTAAMPRVHGVEMHRVPPLRQETGRSSE